MKKTIDVGTLREWLEQGKPVTVVDVRTNADYAEWFIPGSVHINAYEELKANNPHALAELDVPTDTPIVTICGAGNISVRAAEQLEARGYEAVSLAGGMKAWSLAWNSAEVPAPTQAKLIQVRRTGKGCLSYLIISGGHAAVIDASLPPAVYRELADAQGVQITHVLETHIHADHLSRSRQLAEATGADLLVPENDRVSFSYMPVRDGDTIAIGSTHLGVLHTPGHTWESTSYVLDEAAVFTGDTLFLESVGRPDLHASEDEGRTKAQALYHSLHRLCQLPPSTVILPGHTSTPVAFDTIALSAPLGEVMGQTPLLREDEQQFVATVLGRIGGAPLNYHAIVDLNEHGRLPEGDPSDLEAGANRCAIT